MRSALACRCFLRACVRLDHDGEHHNTKEKRSLRVPSTATTTTVTTFFLTRKSVSVFLVSLHSSFFFAAPTKEKETMKVWLIHRKNKKEGERDQKSLLSPPSSLSLTREQEERLLHDQVVIGIVRALSIIFLFFSLLSLFNSAAVSICYITCISSSSSFSPLRCSSPSSFNTK